MDDTSVFSTCSNVDPKLIIKKVILGLDQSRRKSMALIVVRLIVLVQPPFNTVQYEKVEYCTMRTIKTIY